MSTDDQEQVRKELVPFIFFLKWNKSTEVQNSLQAVSVALQFQL